MKTLSLIVLVISFLILFSCNRNDDEIVAFPQSFEVSVDSLNSTSALVLWTSAKSSDNEVFYDVYLNDSLLVENLDQLKFSFNNLTQQTNYTAKVFAKNVYGTAEASIDFMTTAHPSLLLSEYNYDDQYWKVKIKYNSSGQMVEKGLFENGDTTRGSFMSSKYFYNTEGALSNEMFTNIHVYGKVDYFYNNNSLTKIIDRIGAEDVGYTTYEFNEDATFYSQESEFHCGGCDPPLVTIYNQHENFVTYNGEGFITRIERKNLEGELVDDFTFRYNNGNIIEIVDVLNSDKLEVNYDDSQNFNTYITGIQSISKESILGLPYLEPFRTILSNKPLFFKFNNVNNPLEYKFNGEVIKTFRYEYNEYGYPVKINTGPTANTEITLEYITNP